MSSSAWLLCNLWLILIVDGSELVVVVEVVVVLDVVDVFLQSR